MYGKKILKKKAKTSKTKPQKSRIQTRHTHTHKRTTGSGGFALHSNDKSPTRPDITFWYLDLLPLKCLAALNKRIHVCTTYLHPQLCPISGSYSVQRHRLPSDLAMLLHWLAILLQSFSASWLQQAWQVYRAYRSWLCKANPLRISTFYKRRLGCCVLALFTKSSIVFIFTYFCIGYQQLTCIAINSSNKEYSYVSF